MASRAAPRPDAKGPTATESRKVFCAAFVQAVDSSGASLNSVARWVNRSSVTVRGWLRGTHRIDFEAVRGSTRLWGHFLRCLVVLERKARRV